MSARKASPAEQARPMGLYVHIPFCRSRCHYCDFVSTAGLSRAWQIRYRDALRKELAFYMKGGCVDACDGRVAAGFDTLYFGGGTPTYLDADLLEEIAADFAAVLRGGVRGDAAEFTVEANPGTLTAQKLAALRRAGCNRLSVGAQSFDDSYLVWLGRSHNAAAFRQAWEWAREAGFTNMNLDLLYGLPDQSMAHWERTLREALAYQPEHISLYQLNIEPGTRLAQLAGAGQNCAADEECCRGQYLLAHRMLTGAGYSHYEISNYAKPGRESRHNTQCWRNGYYLGLGAGAAGYLPEPRLRYVNTGDLERYLADTERGRKPVADEETIDTRLAMAEEMMLAFRLREGVDAGGFQARWGVEPAEHYGAALEKHLATGLLEKTRQSLRPTLEGWLTYNVWVPEYL
ncbi:MAG: radical SAM family heme chaperone HemW [Clostridiales bacterium]|nr:radical SAM family heme chaperone HemW [Clostridiales bacterium]